MSSEEIAVAEDHAVHDANDTQKSDSPARQESDHTQSMQPASELGKEINNPQTVSTPEETASATKRPPKMRLKLSMRKLPTLANRKLTAASTPKPDAINSDDEDEV